MVGWQWVCASLRLLGLVCAEFRTTYRTSNLTAPVPVVNCVACGLKVSVHVIFLYFDVAKSPSLLATSQILHAEDRRGRSWIQARYNNRTLQRQD